MHRQTPPNLTADPPQQVGRAFRVTCTETLNLLLQGVTGRVLLVWGVTLLVVCLGLLSNHGGAPLASASVQGRVSERLGST